MAISNVFLDNSSELTCAVYSSSKILLDVLRNVSRFLNPLTAKLLNLNFHPLEVVSR